LNETNSSTILAFDYGLSQIGTAIGNSATATSQALGTLRARDGVPRWEQIQALLDEWQPGLVLVGLPLNMDGSESDMSGRAQKFGRRLEGRFGVKIAYMDERLSSFEAKSQLREQGHRGNFKDSPADAVAAELILQSWLSSR
jgi:putative Holliday junction resolvase